MKRNDVSISIPGFRVIVTLILVGVVGLEWRRIWISGLNWLFRYCHLRHHCVSDHPAFHDYCKNILEHQHILASLQKRIHDISALNKYRRIREQEKVRLESFHVNQPEQRQQKPHENPKVTRRPYIKAELPSHVTYMHMRDTRYTLT